MNVREIFTHDRHLDNFIANNPSARQALEKLLKGKDVDHFEYNLAARAMEEAVKDAIYRKERGWAAGRKKRRK